MSDTSRDPSLLQPPLQAAWRHAQAEWAKRHPALPRPILTATYRGPNDQERAFRAGKSRARFGQSLHNFKPSYAFDVAFIGADGAADWSFPLFEKMAEVLEPLGLEWGGRWPRLVDGPHFQLPMSVDDARQGRIPPMPAIDALSEKQAPAWLLVVMRNGDVEYKAALASGESVVTRVDPARHRVYVDVRGDS
jgi:peptidoglycan L-alanyl-D-glutamate endopeptidase CwlK